jgi:glycosyltransferase involved in cell wall biosynthesis
MKRIRLVSFPTPSVNPYYALYYGGLARFGVEVEYRNDIVDLVLDGPTGRTFDAVHFHWDLEKVWRAFGRSAAARSRGVWKWYQFLRRARRAGLKVLWTVHELEPIAGGSRIDWLGYLFCSRAADLCICHSELCRQEFVKRFSAAALKTIMIPHGTYDGVLVPTQERDVTCARWKLPTERRLLLTHGFQVPRKGLDVALEAMRWLEDDYHLVVQTSATEVQRRWLNGLVNAYGASPNVSFILERLSDVDLANLLAAADCILLPYLRIVSSGALAAALTVGRGVVVSDLGYFREALAREPEAAVFFPPGDAPKLAAAVSAFFAVDASRRHAAASRLAARLRWEDLVTPIGEWLQGHCAASG